jgi:c-di-AMP phosphodiesterase-like protein
MNSTPQISKGKLILGASILVIGFLSPLLIAFVTNTSLSVSVKTTISGLLAFGIPEVFMLIAIAIMGKQGYEYIKNKAFKYLKQFAPADEVSLRRHRFGLVMFSLPLLFGWLHPYLAHYFPFLADIPIWQYIIGDIIFIASFFVLGGDFWDKFSGLFKHKVKISRQA